MRKLKVGVTVFIDDPKDSFWTNGIKQNTVTLQKMFSFLPNVEECKLINFGKLNDFMGTAWEPYSQNIITLNESLSSGLDVVVTALISPPENYLEELQKRKIKVVKHVMGNEYEIFSEQVLFEYANIPQTNFYGKRPGYDASWISPHFYEQNKDIMEIITDAPSYIGPYVWDKRFIEHSAEQLAKTLKKDNLLYSPSGKQEKRISTFEPNINLVKTCITPMIAMEMMHRKQPDLIDTCKIFGSNRIKEKKIFVQFAKDLTVYKNGKMTFEARFPMAISLWKYTDIVIAHQRNLDLNYAYFDAAWLGYPLVHNSKTLSGLGYYYDGWDADMASDVLIEVAREHDLAKDKYMKKSREYISRFFPEDKGNIEMYAKLFEDLFK